MTGKALTHCPRCGSAVTPFAAGCAICGTDLDAARARRARGWTLRRPSLPRLTPETWLLVLVVAILTAFASLIGVLVAAYAAYDRNRRGDERVRDVLIALALAGVAFLVFPALNPVNLL